MALPQTIKMLHTNDPLAILGDLEVDLVFSFLSVPETIIIRGVSTLWKARVDFRLTKSAIRRHYPTAEETQAVYSTRDEEAVAFRRVAYRYEAPSEPSIARIIRDSHRGAPWCLCNNHIVRTDPDREWLHIQRIFDPKDPQRQSFPTKNLGIKSLPSLQGKSRIGLRLKIQWITGSDTSGVIVLHVGVDNNLHLLDPRRASHPRWTLAISLADGQVVWCHKAEVASDGVYGTANPYQRVPEFRGSPTSLGHGNACIMDIGGNLTILDLTTGQQRACAHHPDYKFPTTRTQSRVYNLTAHPTMELCFAILPRSLNVFSTKTAQLIKTFELNNYLPEQRWSWTKLHFTKRPITEGGGERAWLLCDAWNFAGQVWMHGSTSAEAVVTYEIDLEKLELIQVAIWKIAHHGARLWTVNNSQSLLRDDVEGLPRDFAGVHLRFLNPATGMGCICVAALDHTRSRGFQIWTVKFKQTGFSLSIPDKHPPIVYEVEDYHHITLPKRKPRKSGREDGENTLKKDGEPAPRRGRREFVFENPPLLIDSYFSERYMAFTTGSEIYLFGFMPRW